MIESELTAYAKAFLKNAYQLDLKIPVNINQRLRSTYGRFIIKERKAFAIDMAGFVIEYADEAIIKDILRHECIHYALFCLNQPYKDKDRTFKFELAKHKTARTRSFKIGKYHRYRCQKCASKILSRTKRIQLTPERYRSTCCQAPILPDGYQIFTGQ